MMKKLLFLMVLFGTVNLSAQDLQMADTSPASGGKFSSMLGKISVTATAGTPAFALDKLGKVNFKKLSQLSLSNLNISYKVNPRLSLGISSMNNLSNSTGGYYNAENQFFTFCNDDEDDDDGIEDDDMEIDDDDIEHEDEDGDCGDDEFGQNLMGTATFILSDKLPFFVQAAGGYSLSGNAPAYSAMVGYNQKVFAGLGIMAGIRFSDVLHKKPADAVKRTSTAGIKAELGLSWNF